MIRLIIVTLLALGIVLPCEVQGSTDHPISKSDAPESQVEAYFDLGEELYHSHPDSSLSMFARALEIAQQHELLHWEAKVKVKIGKRYQMSGEIDSALHYIEPGLARFRRLQDSLEIGKSLRAYSSLLTEQGKTETALIYLVECVDIYQKIGEPLHLAYALNAIGANYYTAANWDKAEEYFKESLGQFQALEDISGQALLLTNLANVALQKGQPLKAADILGEAIMWKLQLGDDWGLGDAYNSLGACQFELEAFAAAEASFLTSLSYRQKIDYQYGIAESKLNLGNVYRASDRNEKANQHYNEALDLASEIGAHELMVFVLREQAHHYRDNAPGKALYYMDSLRVMDSIIFQAQKAEAGALLEAHYQSEQAALQIENLEQKQRISDEKEVHSDRERRILSTGLLILLVFMVVLAFLIFNQKKLNRELRQNVEERMARENQLQLVNDELNTLVYKSSHDLKSPLDSLKGLIGVIREEEDLGTVQVYLGMMDKKLDQLKAFVTNLLSVGQMESQIPQVAKVKPALLLESVLLGLQNMAGMEKLEIIKEIPVDLAIETDEMTLRSAMQNLVSNAAKYQDMQANNSFCRISATQQAGILTITVKDNGIGIKSENLPKLFGNFTRFSTQAEGSGIGLYYVRKSIQKLGGDIVAQSEFGKGTEFVVTLPGLN